jgi:LPS O-antigen subunit length determinant protein (WzzB/FepE family)
MQKPVVMMAVIGMLIAAGIVLSFYALKLSQKVFHKKRRW